MNTLKLDQFAIWLCVIVGQMACTNSEDPISDCVVDSTLIWEYVSSEGTLIQVFENGEAYSIANGDCVFAAQFYTPGFFEANYVQTESGIFLKTEDGGLFQVFDSFSEDLDRYDNTLDVFIKSTEDRTRLLSSFTLQSPSAKTVNEYVALRKCILDESCDFIDNRFDLVPDPEDASNQVLRFFSVKPSDDMVTAKSSISSTLVAFRKGDDFWFEGRFFVESGFPTTLADFESSYFESGPGPRLIFKGNNLAVENKFGSKITYRQTLGAEIPFPIGQWVSVKVHFQYDEVDGIIEVWQDGVQIISATGQNIPVDFWIQDRIEIGISATSTETVMYADDFKFAREPI